MIARILSYTIGALVLIAVASLYVLGTGMHEEPTFQTQRDLADTLLLYELRPNESLRFSILPGDKLYYVLSHVRLPSSVAGNGTAETTYGFDVSFIDPSGKELKHHVFYERSMRMSVLTGGEDPAFLGPSQGVLTDLRITAIQPASILPLGGEISIRLIESNYPVLLRIYRIETRGELDRLRAFRSASKQRRNQVVSYIGLSSELELSPEERLQLFKHKWIRIGAKTPTGGEPPTVRVYYRKKGFFSEPIDESLVSIEPNMAVAINLTAKNDTMMKILLTGAQPMNARLTVLHAKQDPAKEVFDESIEIDPKEPFEIRLRPGVQTIIIHNSSEMAHAMRFSVPAHDVAPIGNSLIPIEEDPETYLAVPDKMHIYLNTISHENQMQAEMALSGFSPSTPLRITLRPIASNRDALKSNKFIIEISFTNKHHKILYQKRIEISPQPSEFESVYPEADIQGTINTVVSEPTNLYLYPPAGTSMAHIRAIEGAMLISAASERPIALQFVSDYPNDLVHRTWRYKREPSRLWQSLRSKNWIEFAQNKQRYILLAQTRLEPILPKENEEQRTEQQVWGVCYNENPNYIEYLYIRSDDSSEEDPQTKQQRSANMWLKCPQRRNIKLELWQQKESSTANASYSLYGKMIAGKCLQANVPLLKLFINDKLVMSADGCRNKSFEVSNIPYSSATIRWEEVGGSDQLLIKPVIDSQKDFPKCDVLKSFMVYSVQRGESTVIEVDTSKAPGEGANIIAYTKTDTPICMNLYVDSGSPKRKPTRIATEYTPSVFYECKIPSKSIEYLSDRGGYEQMKYAVFFVPLKNDLKEGLHTIKVQNRSSKKLLIRAFRKEYCSQPPEYSRVINSVYEYQ